MGHKSTSTDLTPEPKDIVCEHVFPTSGRRCGKPGLPGFTFELELPGEPTRLGSYCFRHGGDIPAVQEHARKVVTAGRMRLVENTDLAVDTLLDLIAFAQKEDIKFRSAVELLSIVGVKGAAQLEVTVSQGESGADRVRRRLEETRDRMLSVGVVEATIIADPDDEEDEGSSPAPDDERPEGPDDVAAAAV